MKHLKEIASAIIIAAIILGIFYYQTNKQTQTVKVVGYASKEYESDIIKWNVTLATIQNSQAQGYEVLSHELSKFKDFLSKNNLNPHELEIMPNYSYGNFNRDGIITSYNFEQTVAITVSDTTRFSEIEMLSLDMTKLIKAGISIRNSTVSYYISALPELKIEIISDATKDARERALQVAKTTGTKLGKLLNGRVGVFQITEPLSVEVQSYGIYSTHTRKKQISVTFSGEFQLK